VRGGYVKPPVNIYKAYPATLLDKPPTFPSFPPSVTNQQTESVMSTPTTQRGFICGKGRHYHPGKPTPSFICNHICLPKEAKKKDGVWVPNTCESVDNVKRATIESKALTLQTPGVMGLHPGNRPERGWVCSQSVGVGSRRMCGQYQPARHFPSVCAGCCKMAEEGKVLFTVMEQA
jgi:hypothetical protein